jgi:hypothetical protein
MFKTYIFGAKIVLRLLSAGIVGTAGVIIYLQFTGANPLTALKNNIQQSIQGASQNVATIVAEVKPTPQESIIVNWGPIVSKIDYGAMLKVADIKSVQMRTVKYDYQILTYHEIASLVFDYSFSGYAQFDPKDPTNSRIKQISTDAFEIELPPLEIVLSPVIVAPTMNGALDFYQGLYEKDTKNKLADAASNQFSTDLAIRNFLRFKLDSIIEKSNLEAQQYYESVIKAVVGQVKSDNKVKVTIVRSAPPTTIKLITTDLNPARRINIADLYAITPQEEQNNLLGFFPDAKGKVKVESSFNGTLSSADVKLQVQPSQSKSKQ